MSSLWTPAGEHPVEPDRPGGRQDEAPPQRAGSPPPRRSTSPARPAGTASEELSAEDEEQVAARLEELRRQLISTPAEIVVANHAYGLFELAAIHLSQSPPRLDDARLAIDALAAVVEGLEGRLGEPERSLRDALAQIRLAYVQIGGSPETPDTQTTRSEPT